MSALQFLLAAIGSAVVISVASLVWPKVTNKPRPAALTQVRNAVVQTQVGQQAAQVLGVSDEAATGPVNVRDWAVAEGNAIVNNITDSASQAVVSQVVKQMLGQIDKLPGDQKQQLQQILCAPPVASSSATK